MKTLAAFAERIRALETFAQSSPRVYQARVAGLAVLGIGYVLLVFLIALACGVGGIAAIVLSGKGAGLFKLAWISLAFAWLIGKAMWIRLDPPEGRPVTPGEAPALFEEIERVRRGLDARRIHRVVVTHEFNAGVCQVPRLGILGWPRNYLILGLPLLAALPVEQLRAVLGHEFGHLARNHSRFGNWIYRTRQTWYRVVAALEARQSKATRLFTRFLDWYAPFFNAYSFVLARANEYEADRESARIAGAANAARALTAVSAKGEYLASAFWEDFYSGATTDPDPPPAPYSRYLASLRALPAAVGRSCLDAALERRTTLDDTHPCLAERLAALGAQALPLEPVTRTAAEALLGELAGRIAAQRDAEWRPQIDTPWRERHELLARNQELLERLRSSKLDELAADELWDYARAVETVEGTVAALPVLDRLTHLAPAHAGAHYMRGRILLRLSRESGVADIERAMQLDSDALEPGSQLLCQFFYARNELDRCQPHLETLRALDEKRELARRERESVAAGDPLDPHGLGAEGVAPFAAAVRAAPGARRAWLARKRVVNCPELPMYVVVIEFSRLRAPSQQTLQRIANAMPDGPTIVVLNKAAYRPVWGRIQQLEGTLIFPA